MIKRSLRQADSKKNTKDCSPRQADFKYHMKNSCSRQEGSKSHVTDCSFCLADTKNQVIYGSLRQVDDPKSVFC